MLLLVTHPTLVAAAIKGAFACPKNSLVNQRLKSSVMLRAVSPHSELFTSICFQEFHPSWGLSLEDTPATVTLGRQSLTHPPSGFSVYIFLPLLLKFSRENVFEGDSHAKFPSSFLNHFLRAPYTLLPYVPNCDDEALFSCSSAHPLDFYYDF